MTFVTHLALLAGMSLAVSTAETVKNVTVASTNAGACSQVSPGTVATSAAIQVSWQLTNPDATNNQIKVYENNVLVATLAGDATSWPKTVNGSVEYGSVNTWASDWTYRVDVVEIATGQVISSATANHWVQAYGGC